MRPVANGPEPTHGNLAMNRHLLFPALAAALMAGALMLAGCDKNTPGEAATLPITTGVTDANVADKVQQAATPADHQNLATYYDAQAQAAEREAGADRELRMRYARRWRPGEYPMGPGALEPYDHLIEGQEDDIREYRALAEWHREMARHAEPPPAGE